MGCLWFFGCKLIVGVRKEETQECKVQDTFVGEAGEGEGGEEETTGDYSTATSTTQTLRLEILPFLST